MGGFCHRALELTSFLGVPVQLRGTAPHPRELLVPLGTGFVVSRHENLPFLLGPNEAFLWEGSKTSITLGPFHVCCDFSVRRLLAGSAGCLVDVEHTQHEP